MREARENQVLSSRKSKRLGEGERICSVCLERQGATKSDSKKFGTDSLSCSICNGAVSRLQKISSQVLQKLSKFEFATFLVGASLPQHILDREDEVRSVYKIRGREGIRSQITKAISNDVTKKLGKRIDYYRPDLTVVVSLIDDSITTTARSIWLSSAYLKTERGMPQRSFVCEICNGIGCAKCGYRGSDSQSVESVLTSYFTRAFKGRGCNFVWIGSEDSLSLVGGRGRPFFVEVLEPKKRYPRILAISPKLAKGRKRKALKLGSILLPRIEPLTSRPKSIPQFRLHCVAYLIESNLEAEARKLDKEGVEAFSGVEVSVRLSGRFRTAIRKIDRVNVRENSQPHPYALEIACDGGIPIRKFISGDGNVVSPNLSQFIKGYAIDPSQPFDVEDIEIVSLTMRRAET